MQEYSGQSREHASPDRLSWQARLLAFVNIRMYLGLKSVHDNLGSPLVDDRPIMNAVKYRVVSGVVWTNRTINALDERVISLNRGRGGVGVRRLTSHIGELDSIPGGFRSRILACGNLAGQCHWSAGFSRDLSFSPALAFRRRSTLAAFHPHRISRPRHRLLFLGFMHRLSIHYTLPHCSLEPIGDRNGCQDASNFACLAVCCALPRTSPHYLRAQHRYQELREQQSKEVVSALAERIGVTCTPTPSKDTSHST
ncbi:hypothetical protein PR048_008420 [Dryococelus australis]|uniref:Uncharacterized protein n=1 Tax=Dryococelus australis TaxID=614101 RepID=A0ABQ9HX33_9NEOP|nr:hypothetical protein PR048_008420 [Dryococelus australis]